MGWKEASTLILLALKEKPYSSMYNYNVLMLKRSSKSSFMPSGYVFPGGTVDSCDSHPKWKEMFIEHGYKEPFIQANILESNLPPILKSQDLISRHVSLRITAIRETFEETGVFLCRTNNQQDTPLWSKVFSSSDALTWRSKVQNDPSSFYDLCKSLKCVPDIWSLKLWSNWLTPPEFDKRFDTLFFTACLLDTPQSTADNTEIEQIEWFSPEMILKQNSQKKLWLPPPQLYEISRIMRFCMLEDLAHFANDREKEGCDRIGTERFKAKDGFVFPLPGDDAYGEENLEYFADCTLLEARAKTKHLNRMEFSNATGCRVISDNSNPHGHVMPISDYGNTSSGCCKNR